MVSEWVDGSADVFLSAWRRFMVVGQALSGCGYVRDQVHFVGCAVLRLCFDRVVVIVLWLEFSSALRGVVSLWRCGSAALC